MKNNKVVEIIKFTIFRSLIILDDHLPLEELPKLIIIQENQALD